LTLLLTLTGFSLRFYRLSNQSLWTDEISSITTARMPLSQIMEQSGAVNNCLQTYFLLLRAVLGESNKHIEFRARWLSALAGALSVPLFIGVVYFWRRRWSTALLAGLLLAVNPLHLWYSQEVRAYGTMLFFGLLTVLAYELARLSRKPWWWLVYGLAALVAVALHKTALVFPVACALWHGWEVLRRKGRLRELVSELRNPVKWARRWSLWPLPFATAKPCISASFTSRAGFPSALERRPARSHPAYFVVPKCGAVMTFVPRTTPGKPMAMHSNRRIGFTSSTRVLTSTAGGQG